MPNSMSLLGLPAPTVLVLRASLPRCHHCAAPDPTYHSAVPSEITYQTPSPRAMQRYPASSHTCNTYINISHMPNMSRDIVYTGDFGGGGSRKLRRRETGKRRVVSEREGIGRRKVKRLRGKYRDMERKRNEENSGEQKENGINRGREKTKVFERAPPPPPRNTFTPATYKTAVSLPTHSSSGTLPCYQWRLLP